MKTAKLIMSNLQQKMSKTTVMILNSMKNLAYMSIIGTSIEIMYPEFENENLRKAFFYAIDRDSAADVILNDGSEGANYIVPKEFAEGPDGEDFHAEGSTADIADYPETDKEKAQEYWEKAKKELDIEDLDIEYMTTEESTTEELADYYVNELEETLDGLNNKINKQTFKSYLDMTANGEAELAAGVGLKADYEDTISFLELFTTGNSINTFGLSDEKYDSMIEKAGKLGDEPEKRWELLQEAEQYLIDKAMIIPTYQEGEAELTKDYVSGNIDQVKGLSNYYRYAEIKEH